MKPRPFDPHHLDLPAFCRAGATLEGEWLQAGFLRLAEDQVQAADGALPAASAPVRWSAHGELRPIAGSAPALWLHLQGQTVVSLECQRCLQPMAHALTVARWLRFVADEDEAAQLDEESEDDVLALPRRLDLRTLLEDELILALPLVPRHERCPVPLPAAANLDGLPQADDDAGAGPQRPARPNPFAALAVLRRDAAADRPADGPEPADPDPETETQPAPVPRRH
jgi:uncharacterized protein